MSQFIGRYVVWMIAGLLLIGLGIRSAHGTYRGRRVIDGLLLKAPVIGMLLRKVAVARFCRTLGTLISSGVPIENRM